MNCSRDKVKQLLSSAPKQFQYVNMFKHSRSVSQTVYQHHEMAKVKQICTDAVFPISFTQFMFACHV